MVYRENIRYKNKSSTFETVTGNIKIDTKRFLALVQMSFLYVLIRQKKSDEPSEAAQSTSIETEKPTKSQALFKTRQYDNNKARTYPCPYIAAPIGI